MLVWGRRCGQKDGRGLYFFGGRLVLLLSLRYFGWVFNLTRCRFKYGQYLGPEVVQQRLLFLRLWRLLFLNSLLCILNFLFIDL